MNRKKFVISIFVLSLLVFIGSVKTFASSDDSDIDISESNQTAMMPLNTPEQIPTPPPAIVKMIPNTPSPTPVTAPSKPTIKSAKNSKKKSVTLSWKKVKNADGYQIQYATNEAFSKKSKVTKNTKVTIKSLKKKKTYSFRVRAYTLDGKKRVYSSWSKVKRVKIKK